MGIDTQKLIDRYGLWGVAAVCFLSATLLPGVSEVGLAALAVAGIYRPLPLVASAAAGNWLGGVFTFATGWFFGLEKLASWCGIEARAIEGVSQMAAQYGAWAGLLVWTPVIGDPIAAALGMMHAPAAGTCLTMLLGKAARYALLVWLALRAKQLIKKKE